MKMPTNEAWWTKTDDDVVNDDYVFDGGDDEDEDDDDKQFNEVMLDIKRQQIEQNEFDRPVAATGTRRLDNPRTFKRRFCFDVVSLPQYQTTIPNILSIHKKKQG